MDESTARLAQQLKQNPDMLRSLMQSRDGQTLMNLLTRGDQGAGLQQAAQAAAQGNPAEMVQMMNRVMQSPDGAALVERIRNAIQK